MSVCRQCEAPCTAFCAPAAAAAHPAVSPGALVQLARAGDHALLRHCTACGACVSACPHDVDVPAVLAAARSGPDRVALVSAWSDATWPPAPTVVLAGCGTHEVGWPEPELAAALAQVAPECVVVPALPCGDTAGDVASDPLAAAQVALLRRARTVVVPTGACRDALQAALEAAGVGWTRLAVLDQWLARFGLAPAGISVRFAGCRLRAERGVATQRDCPTTPVWPPHLTCCGAGEPLRSQFPDSADGAALRLLERWARAGHTRVLVEDAACSGHLRRVAERQGLEVQVLSRARRLLEGPEA